MQLLMTVSEFFVPVLLFYIVGFGVLSKTPVFDAFVTGAKDGVRTAVRILPTLLGLLMGVTILRTSGVLDFLCKYVGMATVFLHVPAPLLPVIIVRIFSSSAATGLALDLFREYGADSQIGYGASLLLSCTETVFYTMSIYFVAAKVKKTRYTLPGALIATAAGVIVSLLLAARM